MCGKHEASDGRITQKLRGIAFRAFVPRLAAGLLALAFLVAPFTAIAAVAGTSQPENTPVVQPARYPVNSTLGYDDLGDWTSYQAILFDTVISQGADIEGPIAIGKRFLQQYEHYDIGYAYSQGMPQMIGYYEPQGTPGLLYGGDNSLRTFDTENGKNNTLYYGTNPTGNPNAKSNSSGTVYGGVIAMTQEMHDRNEAVRTTAANDKGLFTAGTGGGYALAEQEDLDNWFDYWYRFTSSAIEQYIEAASDNPVLTINQFTNNPTRSDNQQGFQGKFWYEYYNISDFENTKLKLNGEVDTRTLVINIDCSGFTTWNFSENYWVDGNNRNMQCMQLPFAELANSFVDGYTKTGNWAKDKEYLRYDLIIYNFIGLETVNFKSYPQNISGSNFGRNPNVTWASIMNSYDKLMERTIMCSNTVFCFPDATTITSTGEFVSGSVIAPDARFTANGGSLNGQLVAQTYIQTGRNNHEIHALPINRKIYEITEDPDAAGKITLFKYLKYHGNTTTTRLSGAEFILWMEGEGDQKQYYTGNGFSTSRGDAQVLKPSASSRVEIDGLPYGTYWLEEVEAPVGYILNTTDETDTDTYYLKKIEISADEKEHTLRRYNEPLSIDLYFKKYYVAEDGSQAEKPLEDVEFHLFRKADGFYSEEGDVRYTNEELITDSEGLLHIPLVPVGHYILREVDTPAGFTYVLEDGELHFSVRNVSWPTEQDEKRIIVHLGHDDEGWRDPANWLEDSVISTQGYGIENRHVDTKTVLTLYKHDSTNMGQPLAGAEFTLWYMHPDTGSWQQMTDNDIMTVGGEEWGVSQQTGDARYKSLNPIAITSSIGYFTVDNLPPGTYRLVEEKAPNGYNLETANAEYDGGFPYNSGYYIAEFELEYDAMQAPAIGGAPLQRLEMEQETSAEAPESALEAQQDGDFGTGEPTEPLLPEGLLDEAPDPEAEPEAPMEEEPEEGQPEDSGEADAPEDAENIATQEPEPPPADSDLEPEEPVVDSGDPPEGEPQPEPEAPEQEEPEPPDPQTPLHTPANGPPPGVTAGDNSLPPLVILDSMGHYTVNIPNDPIIKPKLDITIEKYGDKPVSGRIGIGLLDTDTAQFRVDKYNEQSGEYSIEVTSIELGTMVDGKIELTGLEEGRYRIIERLAPEGYVGLDGNYLTPEQNDFIYFTLEQEGDRLIVSHMELDYWNDEVNTDIDEIPASSPDTLPDGNKPIVWGRYDDTHLFVRVYNQAAAATLEIVKIDGDTSFTGIIDENGQPSDDYRIIQDPVPGAKFRLQRQYRLTANEWTEWEDYTTQEFVSEFEADPSEEDGIRKDYWGNPVAKAVFPEPLIFGRYRIIEVEVPDGYMISSSYEEQSKVTLNDGTEGYVVSEFQISQNAAEGYIEHITLKNYEISARGDIIIQKKARDDNGELQALPAGIPFRLWQISGEPTEVWDHMFTLEDALQEWDKLTFRKVYSEDDFITGSDGTVKLGNIAPGLYGVYEAWDDRYIGDDEDGGFLAKEYLYFLSHQVQLLEDAELTQDYYFHLTVFKVVAIDEDNLEKGVRIAWVMQQKLWNDEAEFDNSVSTDPAWELDEDDDSGQHITVTVINRRLKDLPVDIELEKVDEEGNPLEGARFQLYKRVDFGGDPVADPEDANFSYEPVGQPVESDPSGVVRFENVAASWRWNADTGEHKKGDEAKYRSHEDIMMWTEYLILETQAPAGYTLSDEKYQFMLWANPLTKSLDKVDLYYGAGALRYPAIRESENPLHAAVAASLYALFGSTPISIDPNLIASPSSWWHENYTAPETEDPYEQMVAKGKFKDGYGLGRFYNSLVRVRINFYKRDASHLQYETADEYKLAGAVFALYGCNNDDPGHVHTAGVADADSCWTSMQQVTSGNDGTFTFRDIIPGREYRLVELAAPEGYERALGCWAFTAEVSSSGSGGGRARGLTYIPLRGEADPGTDLSNTARPLIGNRTRYQLPYLGGMGVWWFTTGGVLILGLAGLLLYADIRRRRRLKRWATRPYQAKTVYRKGMLNSS